MEFFSCKIWHYKKKRKNRVYVYSSKVYLAVVALPFKILMALSHGSEKENKKTANCAVF